MIRRIVWSLYAAALSALLATGIMKVMGDNHSKLREEVDETE